MFALGCVLAYALTGQRPFGFGDPAAVLYRTVHEEPDVPGLDGLPPSLRTAITGCLAKDPAGRPTAAELARSLQAADQEPGLATAPDHQTTPAREFTTAPYHPADWLPSAVLRLVTDHSARALDPPPRQTGPAAPQEPTVVDAGRAPSRRRILASGGSAVAVLAASGTGTAAVRVDRGQRAPVRPCTGGCGGGRPQGRRPGPPDQRKHRAPADAGASPESR